MKRVLEVVIVVAALALGGLLLREWRVRAESARQDAAQPAVGVTSDPQAPGRPNPERAVEVLPPIKVHAQPRVLGDAPPPPPPETSR